LIIPTELLAGFLREQGSAPPSKKQLARVESYLRELLLWNKKSGLVAPGEEGRLPFHLFDSLSVLPYLISANIHAVTDIGSGGGFPALPIAIFAPRVRVSCLERSGKKAAFLQNAAVMAGLENVTVCNRDFTGNAGLYECITFRALGELTRLWPRLYGSVAAGGSLIAWKGRRGTIAAEIDQLPAEGRSPRIIEVRIAGCPRERHLVIWKKNKGGETVKSALEDPPYSPA
jgi:16S rRNA (guanine527-N7)-methyltransferase